MDLVITTIFTITIITITMVITIFTITITIIIRFVQEMMTAFRPELMGEAEKQSKFGQEVFLVIIVVTMMMMVIMMIMIHVYADDDYIHKNHGDDETVKVLRFVDVFLLF